MFAWMAGAVCLLAVWSALYALVLSGLQERHLQNDGYARFREQLASQTAPIGGVIAPDAPVALITAPGLGLKDVVVVEGSAGDDLEHGPGHRRDSPLPGQPGVSVIYGRASLFGAPFDRLTNAAKGDLITMTTGQGVFRYAVEDVRHVGDHFPQPLPAGGSRLTLATAEGGTLGNGFTPAAPVYLDANLVGKTVAAPGPVLSDVPDAEKAMGHDLSALVPLVLWLGLLVLSGLALVWSVARWGRWQTWLVGSPLVLAVLWGATGTAVELLPNLM